ncbi:MAG: crotonase/enoyl-CoA hydratase family protein, partial [Alphaproteobacteria bacterium]
HAGAGRSPETGPLRYMVWASDMPGVWNLGGDLRYFAERIRRRDRDGLLTYAHAVVGEGYRNAVNLNLPIVTVSRFQGDALGGGFEAALSSNLLVAEKGSKFGLPEVLFNLFPGMGAYSFLARRISAAYAERLIFSGRIHTAEELHDVGVIDVLTEPGKGVEGFLDHVDRNRDRFNAHRAIYRARQIYHPISRDEMLDIATMWVDTALTLSERDLAKMERLAAAQDKRRARAAAAGLVSPLSA